MTSLSYPNAPIAEWLEAGRVRSSRRSYTGTPIDSAALEAIDTFAQGFRPSEIARVVVLRDAPDGVFTGIVGAYGRVSGSPSALAIVGRAGVAGAEECAGYTGEGVVLEATRLGLDTCWIGGTFNVSKLANAIGLESGERIFCVSPLGYAQQSLSFAERTVFGHKDTGPKPRKPAADIAPGNVAWPSWARTGVEAARLAPSAMNRQPWRFAYTDGRVTISYDGTDTYKRVSKRLDCGIAMMHFEVGARHAGVSGEWDLLATGSQVARYRLT